MKADQPTGYLTPAEVARRFGVSPITVRQWAEKGWLTAIVTPGGHRRFSGEEVERIARQRARGFGPETETPRVLIIDDDIQLTGFLVELLKQSYAGIEVQVAHDGFSGGRQVQLFRPRLILLDLMMPGVDGFEVCASLKSDPATKGIGILAMTGYAIQDNVERILAAGANACFAKPLDIPALVAAIDSILSRTADTAG